MGYWATHTGLDEPPRDLTYEKLTIFLGILPLDGPPEEFIVTEVDAKAVFDAAGDPTLFTTMKAQLLAAKLNALKLPWFADVQFLDGATLSTGEVIKTFGQAMAAADQVLDDVANSGPVQNSDIEAIKDLLDAANNGCPTPTPTPTPTPAVLPEVAGPTTIPGALPDTGTAGSGDPPSLAMLLILGALTVMGLAPVVVVLGRRR